MRLIKTLKCALLTLLIVAVGPSQATELTPNALLDLQGQGLTIATGGTGLAGRNGAITVDIGGPVIAALIYWTVRDFVACADDGSGGCLLPSADNELLIDGSVLITPERPTGSEFQIRSFGKQNNIGYVTDITPIVAARGTGVQTFTVEDGDADNLFRINGAALLVVYIDPTDTDFHRLIVYDGLDFAYNSAVPDAAKVTEPVVFNYDPADTPRVADVTVVAGDGEAGRPDRIQIDATSILNEMNSDEGDAFDVDTFPASIAPSATSTSIQLFSETTTLTTNPDSLLWIVGAMRLPIPGEEGATGRMTGGRNIQVGEAKVGGLRGGMTIHCDITLSNNIQVTWGRGQTGNGWHLNKPITSAICIDDPLIDPVPPAAPFDTFIGEGIGKLNNVDGSAIRFKFIDAGEPGVNDYAEIMIWAPGDDPAVDPAYFSAAGFLTEGGNIQAHFDQPHGGNGPK